MQCRHCKPYLRKRGLLYFVERVREIVFNFYRRVARLFLLVFGTRSVGHWVMVVMFYI